MNTQDQSAIESVVEVAPYTLVQSKGYKPFANLAARYAHIVAVCGVRELGVLVPQAGDVEEEVKLATAIENEESIVDSEHNVTPSVELVSRLGSRARDNDHAARESDYLLSRDERAQVSEDLWRFRHPVNMWLAPIELFNGHEARLTA